MNWIPFALIVLVTAQALPGHSGLESQVSTSTISTTQKNEARKVLLQAKTAALKIRIYFKRQFVLDEIGAAQARAGDLEGAIDTANQTSFSSATINQIGEELAATNDLSRARSLGLQLKEGGSSAIISYIARGQAKAGKIDQALMTAEQIPFMEVRSYALEDIAMHQGINGDYAGARKTFALARQAHEKGLVTADTLDLIIVMKQLSPETANATRKTIDSWPDADKRFAALMGAAEFFWQKGDKASAADWLNHFFRELPVGKDHEFFRYLAIPLLVKLGQQDRAMNLADELSEGMRAKAYNALAVTSVETDDLATLNAAIDRLRLLATPKNTATGVSEYGVTLLTLNLTAALIDHGQFDEASRLIAEIEKQPDVVSKISIEPRAQLQRVFILAQQEQFDAARSLALRIRAGAVDEVERGTALRVAFLLQTRKNGIASTQSGASKLKDVEDRAYALLGIAQALLNIDKVKLGYGSIQVH